MYPACFLLSWGPFVVFLSMVLLNIRHLACVTNVKRMKKDTAFSDFLGQLHTYLFPALAVFWLPLSFNKGTTYWTFFSVTQGQPVAD